MTSVRRRALAAAALAMTAGLTLSACGTGFGAQTNKVYQPAVGANARGEVDVLNALLVANADGSATISAGVVNNGDQEQSLSSVTVTTLDDQELEVASTDKPVTLTPDVFNAIGGASDAGRFRVVKGADAGLYVKVTFTFSDSSPVTIEAPVVARTAEYESIGGVNGIAADEAADKAAQAESDAAGAEAEQGPTEQANDQ
ncbi:MAG: hypothetical protein JWR27_1117 [Aeromicrobium sp.]|nr:hypothetical protein [Aeromicrobium sp.]